MRSTASVCISSRKPGYLPASSARNRRKSHWGASTRKSSGGRRRPKSIGCSRVPLTTASRVRMLVCGSARNRSRSPSSPSRVTVDGWMVSPRKSRKKSACFSSTTTSMPARARTRPSIIPAGPAPAITHELCNGSMGAQRKLTAMAIIGSILVAAAAVVHLGFFAMESVLWSSPSVWRRFRIANAARRRDGAADGLQPGVLQPVPRRRSSGGPGPLLDDAARRGLRARLLHLGLHGARGARPADHQRHLLARRRCCRACCRWPGSS